RCPLSTLEKVNSPDWSGSPWNRSSSGWSLLRVVSPRTPGGASGPYRRRLPPGPPTAVPPPHRQYSRAHTAQHTVLRIQRRLRRIRVVRQRVVVPGETSRAEITCKSNPTTREALIPAGRHRSCASFLFLVVVNPGKRSLPATFRSWPSGLRPVSEGVSCRFQVPLRSVKVDGGRGQAARPGPQGRGGAGDVGSVLSRRVPLGGLFPFRVRQVVRRLRCSPAAGRRTRPDGAGPSGFAQRAGRSSPQARPCSCSSLPGAHGCAVQSHGSRRCWEAGRGGVGREVPNHAFRMKNQTRKAIGKQAPPSAPTLLLSYRRCDGDRDRNHL